MKLVRYDPRSERELQVGDIMTVYHPHSGLPTRVDHKENYAPRAENHLDSGVLGCDTTPAEDSERRPWHPFDELLDFEFADVARDAHLSHAQVDKLLSIINKITTGRGRFTLKTHQQIQDAWDKASIQHTSVSQRSSFTRRFSILLQCVPFSHAGFYD